MLIFLFKYLFSSLFLFIVVHALCDFALQNETMAINKSPNANTDMQKHVGWFYWLISHALIHGGGVWMLTHSIFLGTAETVAHFIIDYFKCKGKYSIHGDQMLHIACKLLWTILFILGF
jgi:hypothetical protein